MSYTVTEICNENLLLEEDSQFHCNCFSLV